MSEQYSGDQWTRVKAARSPNCFQLQDLCSLWVGIYGVFMGKIKSELKSGVFLFVSTTVSEILQFPLRKLDSFVCHFLKKYTSNVETSTVGKTADTCQSIITVTCHQTFSVPSQIFLWTYSRLWHAQ